MHIDRKVRKQSKVVAVSPPTVEDWGDLKSKDLDVIASYKDYFGKSCVELHDRFLRSPISMIDSLRCMPTKPFGYYFRCLSNFIVRGNFDRSINPDLASSYLGLIEGKAKNFPNILMANNAVTREVLSHLSEGQRLYGADPEFYGVFFDRCEEIARIMDW
jgi:hypothetical protein